MARPRFAYRTYGLGIISDFPLPELEPDDAAAGDVEIRLGKIAWPSPDPSAGMIDLAAETQYLAWASVGRFAIDGARIINVEPLSGVSEPVLRLPLLGPVMALLLHLRGFFVLHASAIAIGGRGAIFVGDRGAGKSTTAAALLTAGHQLLADDVVAIDVSKHDALFISPGFPQLKLDRNVTIPGIAECAAALPAVLPDFPKLQHRLIAPFAHTPILPARVYILGRGDVTTLTALVPSEVLPALMRFSYVTRFGRGILAGPHAADHFVRCTKLAAASPVFRLTVRDGVDRLDEVARFVEHDLA